MTRLGRSRAYLPTWADLWEAISYFAATVLGLGVGIALVEGVSADHLGSVAIAAAAVFLLTWLLAAPLRLVADWLGGAVAFVLGLVVQVTVMWLALQYVPGLVTESWWAAALVLLVAAAVIAVVAWLLGAADSGFVVGDVLRRGRRRAAQRRRAARAGTPLADERPPGLLLVILDGVSEPVLRHAIEAGLAPTMARWIASGSHHLTGWWSQVPATTPAATAGLLHGRADHIPAFRWWDANRQRLVVCNHPWDAAEIEADLSDGEGLLAHDGAAVATIFSGDAASTQLVMSRTIGRKTAGRRVGSVYVQFFASPLVFARTLVLTLGEMVKELYQARLAKLRRVEPRISRGGWYVLLRGVTNVTLRGLTTSVVAEHLERGTPSIAVDFVDYDEIAHHAGPLRPESLRSLEGLDDVLRTLETVAEVAPRRYRIVVTSDHGQSLGATFEQVEGRTLEAYLADVLAGGAPGQVTAAKTGRESASSEDWGPLNTLLNDLLSPVRRRAAVHGPDREAAQQVRQQERRHGAPEPASPRVSAAPDDVSVIASGNLALIWFTGLPGRLTLAQVQERWPTLISRLASHRAIGVVVVDSARGLVAIGAQGVRLLETHDGGAPVVEGVDPLAEHPDPDAAARDLARAGRLPHTGDLLLISAVSGGRVHAFEHQVGSHGGLGGDQNRALLLHPTELEVASPGPLIGADAVFAELIGWQRALGLRPEGAA